ncbi:hypothetical protein [Bifidobacterium xylocopae]|uniref:hypothetical protein n=1 Tax=Bifidobacterium xylocopae TaxID=2493119 RepID=UPI0013749DC5|nr:hypothetical protein [Bifidobacterium xylocopae]
MTTTTRTVTSAPNGQGPRGRTLQKAARIEDIKITAGMIIATLALARLETITGCY